LLHQTSAIEIGARSAVSKAETPQERMPNTATPVLDRPDPLPAYLVLRRQRGKVATEAEKKEEQDETHDHISNDYFAPRDSTRAANLCDTAGSHTGHDRCHRTQ